MINYFKLIKNFSPTTLELYAIIFAIGCVVGGWAVHEVVAVTEAHRMTEVMKSNMRGVGNVNTASKEFQTQQAEKEKKNAQIITDLRRRLANAPKCPVPIPDNWLWGTGNLPDPARSGLTARPASSSVEATADCGAVVLYCEDNRQNVCEPAADQADKLRELWKIEQKRINGTKHWWQRGG